VRRKILIASFTIGLVGLLPLACAGDPELRDHHPNPPPESGGFDPGEGGFTSASSSGSGVVSTGSGAGGGGGMMDPGPPVCDDEQKSCKHTFTYKDATAMQVQVLGSFNNWDTSATPMMKSGDTFTQTVALPWQGDTIYKFRIVDTDTWIADPANPDQVDDGFGGKNSLVQDLMCADYTCDEKALIGSFDWRDAVLYFVFIDRFLDGDPTNNGQTPAGVLPPAAYQGGDFAGLLQKINASYFNDLGVNTLWLTVPMDNPSATGVGSDGKLYTGYHGYWPSDLEATEEHFGTLADLKAVVDAAHAKGIKVIIDYAMNHVHISAPIYQQHKDDWFWPLNVNGTTCVCGEGCDWEGVEGKQCWFRDYLPDFNFTNPDARKYSIDNAIKWVQDTGIDGFRLDAVKHIDDAWIADMRSRIKSDIEAVTMQHFYTVGETFTGDRAAIKYYVDPDKKLTGQFDFPLRMNLAASVLMRKTPMTDLATFLSSNDTYYGAGIMSTFIGNHDIPRAIHLAEDQPLWDNEWTDGKDKSWTMTPALPSGTSAFERMANAFTVLFTSKGVPLIYYGDEVGMPGGGDPDNRRMMQWAGYSSGQNLLLDHIKKLGKIRADHVALRRGKRTMLSATADTLAYEMTRDADKVIVVINRSDSSQSVGNLPASAFTDLLEGGTWSGPSVMVPARSSLILTPN
jgi:glycosidase